MTLKLLALAAAVTATLATATIALTNRGETSRVCSVSNEVTDIFGGQSQDTQVIAHPVCIWHVD